MSGIEELKQKTKLSMDEMYDDQSVGILEKNQSGHPDNQLTSQPENQIPIQQTNHPTKKSKSRGAPSIINATQHPINELNVPTNGFTASQNQQTVLPTMQKQSQKMPTCKMTFNLTEDVYKAFNDLYAKRMLQGRKTEKSDLICEAIQWLIKMEET